MTEIDPTGTQPGAVTPVEEPRVVNMKCKTPECDSIQAIELDIPGVSRGQHMYQCVKCRRTWGTAVGGSVEW
ncbi:MAG: hypothetical protein WC565_10005 [Parcubacteria group bacterium]|jgi:transposase-like protein